MARPDGIQGLKFFEGQDRIDEYRNLVLEFWDNGNKKDSRDVTHLVESFRENGTSFFIPFSADDERVVICHIGRDCKGEHVLQITDVNDNVSRTFKVTVALNLLLDKKKHDWMGRQLATRGIYYGISDKEHEIRHKIYLGWNRGTEREAIHTA